MTLNELCERFLLVRCEDSIPGSSVKSSNFNSNSKPSDSTKKESTGSIKSILKSIGNYQDDKDILTTGLVFNDETLDAYKKAGYCTHFLLPVHFRSISGSK